MSKHKPLERQPVILSLLILKEMGITEEQHSKIGPLWGQLWNALVAFRDSMSEREWSTKVLDAILSGDPKAMKGEKWEEVNRVLNEIWGAVNA